MSENEYEIMRVQSNITRSFNIEPIFIANEEERRELERMQNQSIIDAVAAQIIGEKTRLAAVIGRELVRQAANLFLEELEADDKLLTRAEKLQSQYARRRFVEFIKSLWDQFDRFLLYNALEGARSASTIARKSPFPPPEEQRSWLRRLFSGQ